MAQQRTGDEHLVFDQMPTGYLLSDFWRWESSDLLNNTLRGSFSEFIVSSALGIDLSGVRRDWEAYDICFPCWWQDGDELRDELLIEVKSCAYLQSWEQRKLSDIIFSIRPTRAWSPASGYPDVARRQSDLYVFCLYAETSRDRADPLVLDGWEFYIVPTRKLDDFCGAQKTISLPALRALDPIRADYSGIKEAVLQSMNAWT